MPDRGFAFLGFPNLVAKDYCTVSVPNPATSPAGLGPEWLKTEEPTETAVINSVDPLESRFDFSFTKGSDRRIDGIAVINPNLSKWGAYRFVEDSPTYQDIAPTSVTGQDNISGTVDQVDETIANADNTYMSPFDSSLDWSVTLGFPAPTNNPIHRTAGCMFVMRVVMMEESTDFFPKCTAELYQGATLVSTLGYRAVAAPEGQLFIFPWNPSILPDPTASNLRLKLLFEPGDGSPPSYGVLDAVRLYVDTTQLTHDTGWLPSPTGFFNDEDPLYPTINFHYFPAEPWDNISSFSVCFMDDQVEPNPDLGITAISVPAANVETAVGDGLIEVGVVCAGEAIFLSPGELRSEIESSQAGIEVAGVSGRASRGQSYAADSYRYRSMNNLSFLVDRETSMILLTRIGWKKGHSGAFYIAQEPDIDMKWQLYTSFWCTLSEQMTKNRASADRYSSDGDALFYVHASFVEKQ